eukprot:scaffold58240_cov63-Phaeocystis_antarctica.AAC.1
MGDELQKRQKIVTGSDPRLKDPRTGGALGGCFSSGCGMLSWGEPVAHQPPPQQPAPPPVQSQPPPLQPPPQQVQPPPVQPLRPPQPQPTPNLPAVAQPLCGVGYGAGAATAPPQAAAPNGVADRLVQGLLRRGYAAEHSAGSAVANPNQAVPVATSAPAPLPASPPAPAVAPAVPARGGGDSVDFASSLRSYCGGSGGGVDGGGGGAGGPDEIFRGPPAPAAPPPA